MPRLKRRRRRPPCGVGYGGTPSIPVASLYLQPDGVSRYLRPDGTSLYLRP